MKNHINYRPFLPLVLGMIFVLLAGCMSSNRYVIVDPPTVPLKNYSILEIKDFKNNINEPDADALAKEFPSLIIEGLNEHNTSNPNSRLFTEVTQSTTASDKVIVMESTLISYQKGSKTARYLIGFGAGKAYCTIQCVFIDKATGKQILKANFEGELSGGIFGGTSKQTAREVVSSIIDYLEKNY
jgi:hypothetical protein